MMKKVLLLSIGLWSFFSTFSQTARINEYSCSSPSTSCKINICNGDSIELRAYLDGGDISSVVWVEYIMSTYSGPNYSMSEVGNGNDTIVAPFVPLPNNNDYYYRYWLIVYVEGDGVKSAYLDVHLKNPPNAQISGNNEICEGEAVTFFASGGSNYEFMVNGNVVPSTVNQCIISSLGDGDIVKVEVTENGCSATSAPIAMTVHPLPSITTISYSSAYSVATAECVNYMVNVTLNGLTGAGPYTVRIYDEVGGNPGTLFYTVPDFVYGPNGTFAKPIYDVGANTQFFQIEDQNGCVNFPTPTP